MCKHQACRQRLTWLQPCRRQTAAGAFSFSRKRFSQLQTGCCNAKAARPHKQQEKSMQPGLPDISELSPQLQQEWHPDNNALLGGIKPYKRREVPILSREICVSAQLSCYQCTETNK
ncbi:hypothetical protein WJX82_011438 [Trebouxia sp. C0006]